MNGQHFEREIGDYVDGILTDERRVLLEAHLPSCEYCRTLAADLAAIRAAARTLEPQMPATYVWPRIAAAVDEERRRQPWWRLAGGALAWKPLAAVAVMVALLAGGTWMAWREAATAGSRGTQASVTNPVTSAVQTEVQLAEQHYATAIDDLQRVTQTEADSLDPDTARVVQANLAVLDEAIGQSRAALQSEPANPVAQDSLFEALRRKVQLLQDTVALINEMRKGNPEGAARIMSGMNP